VKSLVETLGIALDEGDMNVLYSPVHSLHARQRRQRRRLVGERLVGGVVRQVGDLTSLRRLAWPVGRQLLLLRRRIGRGLVRRRRVGRRLVVRRRCIGELLMIVTGQLLRWFIVGSVGTSLSTVKDFEGSDLILVLIAMFLSEQAFSRDCR
jgi:hypothetical protein